MKFNKILATSFVAVFGITVFAGCGSSDKDLGTKEKGDRTEITFICDENRTSKDAWDALIAAYNDGAGYETDKVFVTKKPTAGVSTDTANSYFTASSRYAANVITVSDNQNTFQKLAISRDTTHAPDGYFVNLTPFAEKDEDFKKNTISPKLLDWWRMTYNKDAKQGAGQPKHVIGAGQNLMGVPFGTAAHFNWYNKSLFEAQGVNIISVEEERLSSVYPNVMPHGYAEYKNAPFDGAKSSKNLAGDTVYKVFNNRIGMNWEEQRVFLKYFTKRYNSSVATSDYGFVSEYWFNYGWSVGGDVMGFDGNEYDFTLLDDSANYIVIADGVKVNNVDYARGDIVRYEDKVNETHLADLVDGGSLYAIKSQYSAIREYVSLQVDPGKNVDVKNGVQFKGYGVATPDINSAVRMFTTEQVAMNRELGSTVDQILASKNASKFDICPVETYREYEGGSTYYKGSESFANEHMLVIGETYDLDGDGAIDDVYTGELKKVNGTPIVGNTTTAGHTQGLIIPACSDPAKYQAAWDFISWVATEGQKYIAKTVNLAPVAHDTLFSADFADNTEYYKDRNYYAVAMASYNVGRGDWGYFENGSWVTDWANDFNGEVRTGNWTLSRFASERSEQAKNALNNMYCVIKGIR